MVIISSRRQFGSFQVLQQIPITTSEWHALRTVRAAGDTGLEELPTASFAPDTMNTRVCKGLQKSRTESDMIDTAEDCTPIENNSEEKTQVLNDLKWSRKTVDVLLEQKKELLKENVILKLEKDVTEIATASIRRVLVGEVGLCRQRKINLCAEVLAWKSLALAYASAMNGRKGVGKCVNKKRGN